MSQQTTQSTQVAADFISELKRVNWPGKTKTIQLTIVVIVISLIIGTYIGIIDTLLASGLKILTSLR